MDYHDEETRLDAVIHHINDAMKKQLALRSMRSERRRQFAVDLAVIGLSLRIGYLVDVVAPQDPVRVFAQLISDLRLTCPEFNAVAHIYEPNSEQSFFVNIPVLLGRHYANKHDHIFGTTFVKLERDGSFRVLLDPPSGLMAVLSSLMDVATSATSLTSSIALPNDLAKEVFVPLAAVLLEYPVAYSPETLDGLFLNSVALDVYECVLTSGKVVSHTLLKFSCPSNLATQHPDILGASCVRALLTKLFEVRIGRLAFDAGLQVLHTVQTLDRVAL